MKKDFVTWLRMFLVFDFNTLFVFWGVSVDEEGLCDVAADVPGVYGRGRDHHPGGALP